MVEIISRQEGPRPQDARLKSLIENNRSTITRLADHLTQGAYSASRAARAAAPIAPETGRVHFVGGVSTPAREPRAVVRATVNGRVVVVDDNSGRQLHHLGNIRNAEGRLQFVLASAGNRFPAPAPADIVEALEDLDAAELAPDGGEEALVAEIAERLGFATQ